MGGMGWDGRTVDREPILDQIPETLKADFGIVLEILDDIARKETEVFILEYLREVPVKDCLYGRNQLCTGVRGREDARQRGSARRFGSACEVDDDG